MLLYLPSYMGRDSSNFQNCSTAGGARHARSALDVREKAHAVGPCVRTSVDHVLITVIGRRCGVRLLAEANHDVLKHVDSWRVHGRDQHVNAHVPLAPLCTQRRALLALQSCSKARLTLTRNGFGTNS
jgi:hypothetical protein